MKVLITGATGFIGTNLIHYLSSDKEIKLFGSSRDHSKAVEKFKDVPVNFVESYSARLFDENGIDCIIHLAGIAHDVSMKFQSADYDNVNFEGTVSLFNEFLKSKATTFIFLSSIKAAVDSTALVVTEDVITNPTSDYGRSKRKAEEYLLKAPLPSGKQVYVLRPVMIHGKGNKGNLNSLYRYIKSGMPYIFGSYENRRSFLNVENLTFILKRFMLGRYPSGIYNLADDEPVSTTELVKLIFDSLGRKPRIWNIPAVILDPLSKIAARLGLPSERFKTKLTENLIVSNAKLKQAMNEPLPVDGRAGWLSTLKSFHEQ